MADHQRKAGPQVDREPGDEGRQYDADHREQQNRNQVLTQMPNVDVDAGFKEQSRQEQHHDDLGRQQALTLTNFFDDAEVKEVDQKTADDERDRVGDFQVNRRNRNQGGGNQQEQQELD